MASFVERVVGAARLDAKVYEEDRGRHDRDEPGHGRGRGRRGGVGGWLLRQRGGDGGGAMVAGFVGWFVWALLTWLIGTKVLPEPGTSADLGQLLRTIGFSRRQGS